MKRMALGARPARLAHDEANGAARLFHERRRMTIS